LAHLWIFSPYHSFQFHIKNTEILVLNFWWKFFAKINFNVDFGTCRLCLTVPFEQIYSACFLNVNFWQIFDVTCFSSFFFWVNFLWLSRELWCLKFDDPVLENLKFMWFGMESDSIFKTPIIKIIKNKKVSKHSRNPINLISCNETHCIKTTQKNPTIQEKEENSRSLNIKKHMFTIW
jgi:hypothetical protein